MPRLKKKSSEERALTYVTHRFQDIPARKAARLAGFSDSTKIKDIEREGSHVHKLIKLTLGKNNIDETFLANEYARVGRMMSSDYVRYLQRLGTLLGYKMPGSRW